MRSLANSDRESKRLETVNDENGADITQTATDLRKGGTNGKKSRLAISPLHLAGWTFDASGRKEVVSVKWWKSNWHQPSTSEQLTI